MSPELQKLIELQDIDVRIFELTDRLNAIPEERHKIEDEFRLQAADYLALEQSLDAARSDKTDVETNLAEYEQTHEKFKAHLMRATNQKEYTTILREIDATKKSISALETRTLELMEQIEKTETQIAERAPEFANRRSEVDSMLAGLDNESARIEEEIAQLRAQRDVAIEGVSSNLLSVYDRVAQKRRGRAMAEVRGEKGGNGKCSACNMALRPQIFADIRRGDQMIVCDNCNRILFYRLQEAPIEASAS